MQRETQTVQPKENYFDEGGGDITPEEAGIAPEETTVEATAEEVEGGEQAPAEQPAKYRIGDKEFATQEEAIAFAQSHLTTIETERQVAEAYRQGLREALSQVKPAAETVTPQKPAISAEELYTNPEEFLTKFAKQIKEETRAELDQVTSIRDESNHIWNEFTQRHPMLADFRGDVEDYVQKNLVTVQSVIATKGRPAAYDYVATQLKARAAAIAAAGKPARELPNGGTVAAPTAKQTTVTKKPAEQKPVSMADAIRNLRKRR